MFKMYLKNLILKKNTKLKKIFCKNSCIPRIFIRRSFFLYKGKHCIKFSIKKLHIGYKFGEFSFTRKPFFFIPKVKKQKLLKR